MTHQELEKSLSKGSIPAICYFYGEEPFLVNRAAQMLLEKALDFSLKDFNLNVFFGNESSGVDIVDAAQTLPMFAERRVVHVKRADQLKADSLEVMLPYILKPSQSTCLLLTGVKVDQRKKFFLEFKKHGVMVEYKKLYDDKLAGFVQSVAVSKGKQIESAAAELLAMLIGNNLQELTSQVEKLVAYVGTKSRISVEDVRVISSSSKAFDAFELARYLGLRDLPNALISLDALFLNEREPAPMIIGAISQHFRKLWRVRELLDNKVSQADIAKETKINPYFLKGYLQEAKNFGRKELRAVFEELSRCDLASKTGGHPYTQMHSLIFGIYSG